MLRRMLFFIFLFATFFDKFLNLTVRSDILNNTWTEKQKRTQMNFYWSRVYLAFFIHEIRHNTHKHTFANIRLFRENYFFFAKIIFFSRKFFLIYNNRHNTLTQTFANIRLFRENYFFFAKIIFFSRKFFLIWKNRHNTHTQTFANIRLFRANYFFFAQIIFFSRKLFFFRKNSS
jgi:hypothetical protein